jgi:hypothetical protein
MEVKGKGKSFQVEIKPNKGLKLGVSARECKHTPT